MNLNTHKSLVDELIASISSIQPSLTPLASRIFGERNIDEIKRGKAFCIFGAGVIGQEIFKALEQEKLIAESFVVSDCDNNAGAQLPCKLISINEFSKKYSHCFILLALSDEKKKIKDMLKSLNVPNENVVDCDFNLGISASFSEPMTIKKKYFNNLSKSTLIELIQRDRIEIEECKNIFSDKLSKETFIDKAKLLTNLNDIEYIERFLNNYSLPALKFGKIPKKDFIPESYFYFNNDLVEFKKDNITFIDIGAFNGCTTLEFCDSVLRKGLTYGQVLAFEPDPDNFLKLVNNTIDLKNVLCFQVAIYSATEKISFKSSENFSLKSSSRISKNGNVTVQTTSIDELVISSKVDIIKSDAPGLMTNLEILKGGRTLITRELPILIFPAYHEFESLYKMPLAIKNLGLNYDLFLRHLSWSIDETFVFAIPRSN